MWFLQTNQTADLAYSYSQPQQFDKLVKMPAQFIGWDDLTLGRFSGAYIETDDVQCLSVIAPIESGTIYNLPGDPNKTDRR